MEQGLSWREGEGPPNPWEGARQGRALVAGMKATERENAHLRGTLERVAELIRRAL